MQNIVPKNFNGYTFQTQIHFCVDEDGNIRTEHSDVICPKSVSSRSDIIMRTRSLSEIVVTFLLLGNTFILY